MLNAVSTELLGQISNHCSEQCHSDILPHHLLNAEGNHHSLFTICTGPAKGQVYFSTISSDGWLLRCEESSPEAGPVQICLYKGIALGKAYVRSTSLEYIISSQSQKAHQYYLYQRLRMCAHFISQT